jgi:hypothetical protein
MHVRAADTTQVDVCSTSLLNNTKASTQLQIHLHTNGHPDGCLREHLSRSHSYGGRIGRMSLPHIPGLPLGLPLARSSRSCGGESHTVRTGNDPLTLLHIGKRSIAKTALTHIIQIQTVIRDRTGAISPTTLYGRQDREHGAISRLSRCRVDVKKLKGWFKKPKAHRKSTLH